MGQFKPKIAFVIATSAAGQRNAGFGIQAVAAQFLEENGKPAF